jgi:hypothetical protein
MKGKDGRCVGDSSFDLAISIHDREREARNVEHSA